MGLLKKILKKAPGPKSPGMKKLIGGNPKPVTKPMAVPTAAPAPVHKPMQVAGQRSTLGTATTKPAAPAAPIGRGPRARTPRQYEP